MFWFLPGSYEIRRTVDSLSKTHPSIDICPLYGGLSLADQRRAIEPGTRRKVVVATNVAETSLTIEGCGLSSIVAWRSGPVLMPPVA